jgi:SAM-dependent methyltransferase
MLEAAAKRFSGEPRVSICSHDLDEKLPDWGCFDAVVSSLAIHHCCDARKRSLYTEIYEILKPGGVFCNLDHVASPTESLHSRFLDSLGISADQEDPSNVLLDVESQMSWLRETGFKDVDCYWKWLELCLFGGFRPTAYETVNQTS